MPDSLPPFFCGFRHFSFNLFLQLVFHEYNFDVIKKIIVPKWIGGQIRPHHDDTAWLIYDIWPQVKFKENQK